MDSSQTEIYGTQRQSDPINYISETPSFESIPNLRQHKLLQEIENLQSKRNLLFRAKLKFPSDFLEGQNSDVSAREPSIISEDIQDIDDNMFNEKKSNRQSHSFKNTKLRSKFARIFLKQQKHQQDKKTKKLNWLQVIYFVNRFRFRLQKALLFIKPELLRDIQKKIINDPVDFYNLKERDDPNDEFNLKNFDIHAYLSDQAQNKEIRKNKRKFQQKFQKINKLIYIGYQCAQKFTENVIEQIPLFNPTSKIVIVWEVLFFLFTFSLFLIIPYSISFQIQNQLEEIFPKQLVINILFLDILRKINSSYFQKGILVKERVRILKNYFYGELCLDFLLIMLLLIGENVLQENYMVAFFLQIFNFGAIIQTLKAKIVLNEKFFSIFSIVELIFQVLIINHFLACIWHFFADHGDDSFLKNYQLANESNFVQYVCCYYFTFNIMSTVGSQYSAQTINEKIINIIITMATSLIFAYTVSTIGNLMNRLKEKNEKYVMQIAQMNTFLVSRNVDESLKERSIQYTQHLNTMGTENKNSFEKNINSLPLFLKNEVLQNIFSRSLSKVKVLSRYFHSSFLDNLSLKMVEQNYGPEEYIFRSSHAQAPCLYIIFKGTVELIMEKEGNRNSNPVFSIKTLKEGDSFGEIEFFQNSYHHQLTVRSVGATQIHCLTYSQFYNVLLNYPQYWEIAGYLRDSLALYTQIDVLGISCLSCGQSSHTFIQCPFIFYNKNRESIYKSYVENMKKQKIFDFKRRDKIDITKYQLLKYDFLDEYQQDNEEYLEQYYETFVVSQRDKIQNDENHETKEFSIENSMKMHKKEEGEQYIEEIDMEDDYQNEVQRGEIISSQKIILPEEYVQTSKLPPLSKFARHGNTSIELKELRKQKPNNLQYDLNDDSFGLNKSSNSNAELEELRESVRSLDEMSIRSKVSSQTRRSKNQQKSHEIEAVVSENLIKGEQIQQEDSPLSPDDNRLYVKSKSNTDSIKKSSSKGSLARSNSNFSNENIKSINQINSSNNLNLINSHNNTNHNNSSNNIIINNFTNNNNNINNIQENNKNSDFLPNNQMRWIRFPANVISLSSKEKPKFKIYFPHNNAQEVFLKSDKFSNSSQYLTTSRRVFEKNQS